MRAYSLGSIANRCRLATPNLVPYNISPTRTINVCLFTNSGPKVPLEIASHAELTNNALVADCGEQAATGTCATYAGASRTPDGIR
jgi:hypothetical protein